jgi:hypothetical protein
MFQVEMPGTVAVAAVIGFCSFTPMDARTRYPLQQLFCGIVNFECRPCDGQITSQSLQRLNLICEDAEVPRIKALSVRKSGIKIRQI